MAGTGTAHLRDPDEVILRAENLVVEFPVGRTGLKVHAVSGISLDVKEGETLGLVGESGCGKSTTGRALMQFPSPTSGSVTFEGEELTEKHGEDLREIRTRMQMIFQDPISSLNPRRKVGDIVAEALAIWAKPKSEQRSGATTVVAALAFLVALGIALGALRFTGFGIAFMLGYEDHGVIPGVGYVIVGAILAVAAYLFAGVGRGLWDRTADGKGQALGGFGGLLVVAAVLWSAGVGFLPVLGCALLLLVVYALLQTSGAKADFPGIGQDGHELVDEVLTSVGLDPAVARAKRPHEFSGGQCQRISIARALVLDPQLIICDEPVSALDVSVQAQILNLLEDMKARYGLTLVFIAHDLAVVKNVSDRVAVMYLGKLCEVAPPDLLYERAAHPYTEALLSAIPVPDPEVRPEGVAEKLQGDLPSPIAPPSGCHFRTRCPRAQDRCAEEEPIIREVGQGQYVACHFPLVDVDAPAEGIPLEDTVAADTADTSDDASPADEAPAPS
jgi:oligopeptide/dipeptide ABC transporter ATP-binding protein